MLLWVGVVVVALSLLAMHQLSTSHTAAGATTPVVASPDPLGGHTAEDVASFDHAHSSDHGHGIDPLYVGGAGLGSGPSTPVGNECPGCGEHQAMALTCLVALISLALGWLLAGPVRWPGLLPRQLVRGLLQDARHRWRRPSLRLVELSISRT